MKIFTILLAFVTINGHFQIEKVEEALYTVTAQAEQPEHQAPDEGVSCLGFFEAICTMTKCVLPVVELEFRDRTPAAKQLEALIDEGKEFHFEAPGMFSVSIRE